MSALRPVRYGLLICLLLSTATAYGGVNQLSEPEFRRLAGELALKVNLFAAAWRENPEAQFYGGTTRDFLYWIKGQFRQAGTREEALRIVAQLRARSIIDVREFIIGESDIDIVSTRPTHLQPSEYGVRKIDVQAPQTFDPQSELWQSELNQGYIPAEKIRLTQHGFYQAQELGDGVNEIYRGKLSVHFSPPEKFRLTKYAQNFSNHPILLALRYLRLQAANYFQTHGPGLPDRALLLDGMDEDSKRDVHAVIDSTLDGHELAPNLKNADFTRWINGTIQKAFRSYTNPTAAFELMKAFRATQLPVVYPTGIEPINQYVFKRYRNPEQIAQHLQKYRVDPRQFYLPVEQAFPDGFGYHGTPTIENLRSIVFQGVLKSTKGNDGSGFYVVSRDHIKSASAYARGTDNIARLPISPSAGIVNTETPYVNDIFKAFGKDHPEAKAIDMYDYFGIDITRFDNAFPAYNIKNSAVLGPAEGVYKDILPLPAILEKAKQIRDPLALVKLIEDNGLSRFETQLIWNESPISEDDIRGLIRKNTNLFEVVRNILTIPRWKKTPALVDEVMAATSDEKVRRGICDYLLGQPEYLVPGKKWIRALESDGRLTDSLIRVAGNEMWIRSAPEFAEKYLALKSNHAAFAKYILSQPASAAHSEWLKAVAESPGADAELVEFALSQPHWLSTNPEYVDQIMERAKSERFSRYSGIIRHILSRPEAASHPQWLEKIETDSPTLKKDILELALTQESWTRYPKLYAKYLADPEMRPTFVDRVLAQSWAGAHPEWVETLFHQGETEGGYPANRRVLQSLAALFTRDLPTWSGKSEHYLERLLATGVVDVDLSRGLANSQDLAQASGVVQTLLDRGATNSELAKSLSSEIVMKNPNWPRWVAHLLGLKSPEVDAELIRGVLMHENAARHPEWISEMLKHPLDEVSQSNLQEVLRQPFWQAQCVSRLLRQHL